MKLSEEAVLVVVSVMIMIRGRTLVGGDLRDMDDWALEARYCRMEVRKERRAREVLVKVFGNSSIRTSFFLWSSDAGGGCFDGSG